MTRVRKQILVVSASEHVLAERVYMLEVRGFRVLRASSAAEAKTICAARLIDAAVVDLDLGLGDRDGRELIAELRTVCVGAPMILVSLAIGVGSIVHPADCFLGRGCCSHAEIFERVKGMTARKLGPRKKEPVSELATEGMVAAS